MTVVAERGGAARASFGPTALERPKDFTLGVSSFDVDGGHFSLELQPAKDVAPASPDTDAVLYVQIALPLQFRASRMVKYGGELRDGYGAWSVGAPGGLPLRLLVGFLRRRVCPNRASTPSTRPALDDSVEVSRRRVGPPRRHRRATDAQATSRPTASCTWPTDQKTRGRARPGTKVTGSSAPLTRARGPSTKRRASRPSTRTRPRIYLPRGGSIFFWCAPRAR